MFKGMTIVFITLCLFYSAFAHEATSSDRIDIIHIIDSYSKRTGAKFVTDPRVKARVNVVGLDLDELSQTNLIDILRIHAFTAYERDGVVYVLPSVVADHLDFEPSELWGSE